MTKLPISVTIVARNEADRISAPILSVRDWVNEIIVVDSGSTDGTQKVAADLGARVVFNEWKGFGFQKKFAADLCRNDWVLNLDADEEVSSGLKQEILALFAHGATPPHNGYWIRISMVLPFEKKPHPFGNYVDIVRLYNRQHAASVEKDIYDQVTVHQGTVGRLKHPFYHRSFRSYAHEVEKINQYTTTHAADVFRKGRHIPAARIIIEPLFAFCKSYFIRRYCLYGLDGFIQSYIYAFARTLRLAKLREMERARDSVR